MRLQSIPRLSNYVLSRELRSRIKRENVATVFVVALIAEFDHRKLYLPAGYPSMYAYCVEILCLSEDAAYKRIRVARKSRRFPELLRHLASGKLTLSAAYIICPHLTEATADALIGDSLGKTNERVRLLIAERFPQSDVPARLVPIAPVAAAMVIELAVRPVTPEPIPTNNQVAAAGNLGVTGKKLELTGTTLEASPFAEGPVTQLAVRPVQTRVTPLSPQRFALECTITQVTHDKVRYAEALLSHRVAPGDLPTLVDRAFDALIEDLEREIFGATSRPQSNPRASHNPRHVPSHVKREVWLRDQGQCTFVSESGQRCGARAMLEFDHVLEFARGGEATVENMRIRCRGHNQYTAERTFGVDFMQRNRDQRAALNHLAP